MNEELWLKVSKKSKDLLLHSKKTRILSDLKAGVERLKEQSLSEGDSDIAYIKKEYKEKDEDFNSRVETCADLYPATEKAIENISGRTFSRKAMLVNPNGVDDIYNTVVDNFSDQKMSMSGFFKAAMVEGMWLGKSLMLVDYNDKTKTPYAVLLDTESILDVRYGEGNEITALRFISYKKNYIDDFTETMSYVVSLYKKDDNGLVTLTKYNKIEAEDGGFSYFEDPAITLTTKIIPVVEYYPETTKIGNNPDIPFLSLANKNIVHFRTVADQRNILHYCRVPLLAINGVDGNMSSDENQNFKMSAAQTVSLPSGSDIKWVENGGANIAQGKDDIENLEQQMESMGAEFLTENVSKTATDAIIRSAEARTRGASMAANLVDAANDVFNLFKFYLNKKDEDTTVDINTDVRDISDQEIQFLIQMRGLGAVSNKTLRQQANERGMLGRNFIEDEEVQRLLDEGGMLSDINSSGLIDEE